MLDDWRATANVGKAIDGVAVVLIHVVEGYVSAEVQPEVGLAESCD
jgi:hypothetical protein